jgi:predicted DNA-binding transcriptional regulator AlpA
MSDVIRKELLTLPEVAKIMGMGRTSFYEWLKDHDDFPKAVVIGTSKKGREIKRWKRKAVESYVELL